MSEERMSREEILAELAEHEKNLRLYDKLIGNRKEWLEYANNIIRKMSSHNTAPFFYYHEAQFGLSEEKLSQAIPLGTPLEDAVRRANAEWHRLPRSQKNLTLKEVYADRDSVQGSFDRIKLMQKDSLQRKAELQGQLDSLRLVPRMKSKISSIARNFRK